MFELAVLVVVAASPVPACPAYADLQQPSVRQGAFTASELDGLWYQLATTEPTMPPLCKCGVNNIHVHPESGQYDYRNTDTCVTLNVSVPIKGNLSSNPATPGLLHENWAPWNSSSHFKLLPNMVFDVNRDASGKVEAAFLYACLGKLVPVVGKPKFSFNILHRSNRLTVTQIDALVVHANATTAGLLDLTGIRYNDVGVYRKCGMLR